MTKRLIDRELGPCIIGCGRDATSKKHRVCSTCYPSLWRLTRKKTPNERAEYRSRLVVRLSRVAAVDQKLVEIGTSPYDWRAAAKSNVIRLNLRARQRGGVR